MYHPFSRLAALQQRDDDKKANEKAKNNLESHIFETKDAMYSEAVVAVTTAEQREVILGALTEAGDWLEDEGYFAETSVSSTFLSLSLDPSLPLPPLTFHLPPSFSPSLPSSLSLPPSISLSPSHSLLPVSPTLTLSPSHSLSPSLSHVP